jgi:hypothetical protein
VNQTHHLWIQRRSVVERKINYFFICFRNQKLMDQNLRLYNLSKMMPLIKCFTSLGAIFILILGLALLGLTVYLFFNNSIFLGNTTTEYTVLGIAFGLSISVIATAGEGIYGICKRKPKMVCAFQIIIIILMAVFFALAISLFFLPDIFFNGGC